MTTKKKKTPRLSYYSENYFKNFEDAIGLAIEGEAQSFKVKDSNYTEDTLYVMLRSVLKFAEEEHGVEGARKLKIYRSGEGQSRTLTLRRIEPVRAMA